MKRKVILISVFILTATWAGLLALVFKTPLKNTAPETESLGANIISVTERQNVTITFAGDIMMDRGVKGSVNKNFNGDYSQLFAKTTLFKEDDISFANLEGPVSDVGRNVGSIYSFRMDPKTLFALKDSGFDIVSVANNHAGDWTIAAFKDTLARLTAAGIGYTGGGMTYEEAIRPVIIEKNGIKIGFIGFTDVGPNWLAVNGETPGILLANDEKFTTIITNAKAECDFLIASFHFGDEYSTYNKKQESLAQAAIDNGANIVVGHHPHVEQEIVYYKDSPIIYSLGNFIFDQYFSPETMQGLVVQIDVGKNNKIKELRTYTAQLNRYFQIDSIKQRN